MSQLPVEQILAGAELGFKAASNIKVDPRTAGIIGGVLVSVAAISGLCYLLRKPMSAVSERIKNSTDNLEIEASLKEMKFKASLSKS